MSFYQAIIFLSFISSLSTFFIPKDQLIFRLFTVFLLLTIVVEFQANKMIEEKRSNTLLYNLFTVFEFGFYYYFFYSVLKEYLRNRKIIYITIVYTIVALLNIFFIQGKYAFHTYTYILGSTICITLGVAYFYFLFKYPKINNLTRDRVFWIVTALLLYYSCTLPIYGLMNFLVNLSVPFYRGFIFIIQFMNYVLYLLFAIGFLCRVSTRKFMY